MCKLEKYAPPGMKLDGWRNFSVTVLMGCSLFSLVIFLSRLFSALNALYDPFTHEVYEDAQLQAFPEVLGIAMKGFPIFAVSMMAFVVTNYLYYFEGSKSIYTMARIRNFLELHIRSWALPLLSGVTMLLSREILVVLYFVIYCLAVPDGIPKPDWRQVLWGLLL